MDHDRFDRLARALATRSSRRRVIQALLGITAGGPTLGAFAVGPARAQGTPEGCACAAVVGVTCCDGTCVDTTSDPNNCGGCGNACAQGLDCQPVQGVPTCVGYQCPYGGIVCDQPNGLKICVPTPQVDPNNCGACGNVCPSGQCSGGACVPASGCPGGCADGEGCFQGKCVMTRCPAGFTDCYGTCGDLSGTSYSCACFDLNTDPANCGSCGNACGAGTTCQAGGCVTVCPTGLIDCPVACIPEVGCNPCVDLSSDPQNCGGCGNACGQAQTCQGGQCVGGCASGQLLCNGICQQCCDASDCPAAPCNTPVCTNGTCAGAPLADGSPCQGTAGSGTCQSGQCLLAEELTPAAGPTSCAQGETPCGAACCQPSEVCAQGPNGPFCGSFFCLGGQPGPDCNPTPETTGPTTEQPTSSQALTILHFSVANFVWMNDCYPLLVGIRNDTGAAVNRPLVLHEQPSYWLALTGGQHPAGKRDEGGIEHPQFGDTSGADRREDCGSGTTAKAGDDLRQTVSLAPGATHEFSFQVRHKWDWIKPPSIADDAAAILVHLIGLRIPQGEADAGVRIWQAVAENLLTLDQAIDEVFSLVHLASMAQYQYLLDANALGAEIAPRVELSKTVENDVPAWKVVALKASLGYSIEAQIGGVFTAWAAWALDVQIITGLILVSSFAAYQVAADPDPDYTEPVSPVPLRVPEVEALPRGTLRTGLETTGDILSLVQAAQAAAAKAAAAQEAGDAQWYGKQLASARTFATQAAGLESRFAEARRALQAGKPAQSGFSPELRAMLARVGVASSALTAFTQAVHSADASTTAAIAADPALPDRLLSNFFQGLKGLADGLVTPPNQASAAVINSGASTPVASPIAAATFLPGATVTVTADGLNLRAQPSTAGAIVAVLPQGTQLQVTGAPQQGGGYTWYPVTVAATGVSGFVAADFLQANQ